MNRSSFLRLSSFILVLLAGLAGSRPLPAQDALAADSSQEIRIGPVHFTEKINAIPVALRASLFANFSVQSGILHSQARLLLDLADLQPRVGQFIDTSGLPHDDCFVKAWIDSITVTPEGEAANIRFEGGAELGGCAFGERAKIISQGFTVWIKAHLGVLADGRTLAVNLGNPDVHFNGLAGKLGAGELGSDLFDALSGGLKSKLQINPVPQELSDYQPRIQSARFLDDRGRLVVEVRIQLTADTFALTKLAQSLANQRN